MATPRPHARWNESGPLTIQEVLRLPATLDIATAARALGFGRTKAYALIRAGEFPCRLIRSGETYRVPTTEIFAALGIDPASFINSGGGTNGDARPAAGDRDA